MPQGAGWAWRAYEGFLKRSAPDDPLVAVILAPLDASPR